MNKKILILLIVFAIIIPVAAYGFLPLQNSSMIITGAETYIANIWTAIQTFNAGINLPNGSINYTNTIITIPHANATFVTNPWSVDAYYYTAFHDPSLSTVFVNTDPSLPIGTQRSYIFRAGATDVGYYDLITKTFHEFAILPGSPTWQIGVDACYDHNDSIYVFVGGGTKLWYKLAISTTSWTNMTATAVPSFTTNQASKCLVIDTVVLHVAGGGTSNYERFNGVNWLTLSYPTNNDPNPGTQQSGLLKYTQGIWNRIDNTTNTPWYSWQLMENNLKLNTTGAGSGNIYLNYSLTLATSSPLKKGNPFTTGTSGTITLGTESATLNNQDGLNHLTYKFNQTIPWSTSGPVSLANVGLNSDLLVAKQKQTGITISSISATVTGTGSPALRTIGTINSTNGGTMNVETGTHHPLRQLGRFVFELTPDFQVSREQTLEGAFSWMDFTNDTLFFSTGGGKNNWYFWYPMHPNVGEATRLYEITYPKLPFLGYNDNSGDNLFTTTLNGTKYFYVYDTGEAGKIYRMPYSEITSTFICC